MTPSTGRFAAERGGRWNPPESFPVVYLCQTVAVARRQRLPAVGADSPTGRRISDPETGPILVRATVPGGPLPERSHRCRLPKMRGFP